MKLEVIGIDFADTIYGITLDEGRTPCLSSLSEVELANFNIPEVEPALWFKTLVLTRVTVDCINRHITWATDKSPDLSPRNDVRTESISNTAKRISGLSDISDSELGRRSSKRAQASLLRKGARTKKFDLKRLSESVFLHGSNADQSTDIEELFMSTEAVVEKYKDKSITKVRFYEEMFRILHCYILPAITFDREDVPQLEAALEFQNDLIKRQDSIILTKDSETETVSQSMTRQRENYAMAMENLKTGLKLDYPRQLAAILLNHFQDDLQLFSTRLAGAQADVNLLKSRICKLEHLKSASTGKKTSKKGLTTTCSISDECPELKLPTTAETPLEEICSECTQSVEELKEHLSEKRLKRDDIFHKYKRTLHIREIMGEYVSDRVLLSGSSRTKVTKRKIIRSKLQLSGKIKVENPLHKIYIGLVELKKEKIRETENLVEDKVRLVSVKEGIRAALEELQTSSSTYGIEFDQFGSLRSTDVMSRPRIPTRWQTLEEEVKQIIDDPQEPMSVAHTDGCDRIQTECKLLLKFHHKYLESESDTDMQSGSPDTASLLGSMPSPNNNTLTGYVNGDVVSRRKSSDNNSAFMDSDEFADSLYACSIQPGRMNVQLRNMALDDSKRSTRSSIMEFEQVEESSEDLVIIHDVSPDYARKAVDKLQKQIKKHMENMSRRLQVQMDRGVSVQKVWACYERIFFAVISSDLKQIYNLAYKDVLRGLEQAVPKLTPFALAMDNSIVYPLFCDKTVQHSTSRESKHSTEPREDSVFVNETDTDEVTVLRETRATPKITRLRSGSTLIKSMKNRNRATAVLDASQTFDFHEVENSIKTERERDDLRMMPLMTENGYASSTGAKLTERREVESECDDFLEICHKDEVNDRNVVLTDERSSTSTSHSSISDSQSDSNGMSVHRKPSIGSNFNLNLAESIISGAASGQLVKEAIQMSRSTEDNADKESLYSRSKYANVLEQINMDYARQVQKNIHIYYPTSVSVSPQERNTWPLAVKQGDFELEVGQDVLSNSMVCDEDLGNLETSIPVSPAAKCQDQQAHRLLFATSSSLSTKTIQIKPEYLVKLTEVIRLFEEMCNESTPTEKLKKAFLALKELGNQFVSFGHNRPLSQGNFGASADELSDFLVVMLCNIDMKLLLQIYINAQMMRDLMAEHLEMGPYGFSVMQLIISLHFLQERIVMQRGLVFNQWQKKCSVVC